jgi:hypothetical protein
MRPVVERATFTILVRSVIFPTAGKHGVGLVGKLHGHVPEPGAMLVCKDAYVTVKGMDKYREKNQQLKEVLVVETSATIPELIGKLFTEECYEY